MNSISLCMIAKNEEKNITACLEAISKYMDEMIIIDTGSTDKTKEIARCYTDKVYDYPWINDFSAARNYAICKASNEFILFIDCDEIVTDIDINTIKQLIEKKPKSIGRLLRVNEFIRDNRPYQYSERVNRLFSKKHYHYEGTIHEQLVHTNNDEQNSDDTYLVPLVARHLGYEGNLEVRKKKTQRNISLLKEALLLNPSDPYLIYQLGKSYYMEEDYLKSGEYFGQALFFDLDTSLEYVQDMVECYGYALINSKQYDKAMQLLNVYDEFSHSADFIFMIALVLMNSGYFMEAIDEFKKAIIMKNCKMEGVNDYLAFYNIAVIYECLGDAEQAKQYYKKSENYVRLIGRQLPY